MTKDPAVDMARRAFADITAALEDLALLTAEGQATPDIATARRSVERLICRLERCLECAQRLRRRLG